MDPRYRLQMKAALRALPSVSMVCPPEELFGRRRGLYLHSRHRGVDWEKPCSLEWIETNGIDPRVPGRNQPSEGARIYRGLFQITPPLGLKTRALRGTNWSALIEEAVSTR